MTDDAAKEWGKERRARRREFNEATALERIDRRKTKSGYKDLRIHVTLKEETVQMGKAKAAKLNYGAGMNFSEYVEMLIWRDCRYGERAREARQQYAMEHKETSE